MAILKPPVNVIYIELWEEATVLKWNLCRYSENIQTPQRPAQADQQAFRKLRLPKRGLGKARFMFTYNNISLEFNIKTSV